MYIYIIIIFKPMFLNCQLIYKIYKYIEPRLQKCDML